jgi:hypothetical protein
MVLLEPNTAKPADSLKLTLMALIAQGVLRFEEVTRKRLFGSTQQKLLVQGRVPGSLPGPAAAVLTAVSPLGGGQTMDEVVKRLRKAFGQSLSGFRTGHLLPLLIGKGLIEPRSERYLVFFNRTRHYPTPEGERERARLRDLLDEARHIPAYLASNPAQALALVAALGSAVLLVEELRPHLAEFGRALAPAGGEFDFDFDVDFDLPAIESIGDSLSALDSGFDAAADGSGGDGGDGGGGGD